MWWTDILALQAHQLRIAKRRGEDKRAIYYDPTAFKPINTSAGELKAGGYKKLAEKLVKSKLKLID